MPRFSVEYKGKWACYSTIVDAFITKFSDKAEHEEWRLKEYGTDYEPIENCNIMTMAGAIENSCLNRTKEEVIKNLTNHGMSENEAEELYDKYKIDPDDEDDDGEGENMSSKSVLPHTTVTRIKSKETEEEEKYVKETGYALFEKNRQRIYC